MVQALSPTAWAWNESLAQSKESFTFLAHYELSCATDRILKIIGRQERYYFHQKYSDSFNLRCLVVNEPIFSFILFLASIMEYGLFLVQKLPSILFPCNFQLLVPIISPFVFVCCFEVFTPLNFPMWSGSLWWKILWKLAYRLIMFLLSKFLVSCSNKWNYSLLNF